MSFSSSMLCGFWQTITDFFTGIFALIPQYIYFFYTCIASLLDALQFVIRKLAGLDGYYINGSPKEGDILSEFVSGVFGLNGSYSALNTVFWSLVVFGAIILVVGTIIAIIKAHYNYDAQKSSPFKILGKGVKAMATFALVPAVTILGVMLSNVLLKALDSITAASSSASTAEVFKNSTADENVFVEFTDEWGQKTYSCYDIFGAGAPTGYVTFSGLMFKAAAHDANRVRYDAFTASRAGEGWSDFGIFNSSLSGDEQVEDVAYMIDYAFANNLHLKETQWGAASVLKPQSIALISSYRYLQSAVWYAGTIGVKYFSKFNVGLVWYYYNLWNFNFIIGFAGILIALTFMSNIVFGLIVRLLECTALLLCLGPIVGLWPLDDGNAFKSWRKTFVSDVLMAYGAVVGMNLLFLLFPYIQRITFFTSPIANYVMNALITLVLLLAVKQLVKMLSNFIGAADAHDTGKGVKSEVGKAAIVGADKAMALVQVGAKVAKFIPGVQAVAQGVSKVADKIREVTAKKAMEARSDKDKAGDKSDVEVSNGTMGKLQEQEIKKLQDKANEAKAKAADENAVAEKAENDEIAKEDKASEDETNKFKAWLPFDKNSRSQFRGADNPEDGALARRLSQEYQKATNGIKDKSTLAKLQDQYAQQFREQNSHAKKSAEIAASREENKKARLASQQAVQDDYAQRIQEVAENGVTGFALTQHAQNARARAQRNAGRMAKAANFIGSDGFAGVVKFAGDNLKLIGGAVGLDGLIDAISKENGVIDKGKLVIRDFAQHLGISKLANAKAMRTVKEKEDADKEEIQSKVVNSVGVKEAKDVVSAINNLETALKNCKK